VTSKQCPESLIDESCISDSGPHVARTAQQPGVDRSAQVDQQPFLQGYLAMDSLRLYLNGPTPLAADNLS